MLCGFALNTIPKGIMARFNHATVTNRVVNKAGGEAFEMSPQMALVTHILTSMVKDQAYRTADEGISELRDLIAKNDPLFVAKTALYARREYGLRSVSHVVAAEIAKTVKGKEWTKSFFDKIVYRPDDMLEILSLYWNEVGKNEPNSLRKGFKKAFARFDAYQLAKYRGEGKDVSLIDVANVVHPLHTEALGKLMKGELKNEKTWEAKISATKGDEAEKQQAWRELLEKNQLGYFALLRNLRNILESDPSLIGEVVTALTNERAIKKSLVMPFRFLSALGAIEEASLDTMAARQVLTAIGQAMEISLSNVPRFEGKTLVVLDVSGSMLGAYSGWMGRTAKIGYDCPLAIGALFAASIYKANMADLMLFTDDAEYRHIDPTFPLAAVYKEITRKLNPSGTNFHAPFQRADKAYDRIIILSDEQGWMGYNAPTKTFAEYKRRTGANPKVFTFDLTGNGTLQLPENDVYCLAGLSDKTLDVLKLLETDKRALIKVIEAVEL